jgi:hypothetical protein
VRVKAMWPWAPPPLSVGMAAALVMS